MSESVIIIVGAGVMGVSTALAAKRHHPEYKIYLINDALPSVQPASEDTGKIIRDAYNDRAYVELAAEAMKLWQAEPAYRDYWHHTGWIVLYPSANGQIITSGSRSMSKERFLEIFPGAKLENLYSISEDPKPAWVEASKALEATVNLARSPEVVLRNGKSVMSPGVILKDAKVVSLLWNGSVCTGVVLDDRSEIAASSVLLAMGHETPFFLKQCKLACGDGQRVGVSVLGVQLNDQQYERYKAMPILKVPGIGEIMPPTRNKIMKINNARSFHVPDLSLIEGEPLTLESPYFKENLDLLRWFLPELGDNPIAFCRYCLDCITPTQDFCIRPLTDRQGLYVAYGGSFHGWKFLSNIGQYVVRMMDGDESFHRDWRRWAGHDTQTLIHEGLVPGRTFPDGQVLSKE